jgi:spermidine synthase
MNTLLRNCFLYSIIFIEGYIVLSSELLAIRQTMPFLGSGTDTISIIIAAVLMPLAFGYYSGGQYKPRRNKNGGYSSIRKKLIRNILVSMCFLSVGLTYIILNDIINIIVMFGADNRLILITIYSLIFLVTPTYLLGQTIPLVSHYYSNKNLPHTTGKILFFSTTGSFLGAVFTTMVLMNLIGVNYTVTFNIALMAFLIIILSKRKTSKTTFAALIITAITFMLNSNIAMQTSNTLKNNEYNNIAVVDADGERILKINNKHSARLNDKGEKAHYIEFIENIAIPPINHSTPPRDILILGAGGFTIGFEDTHNNYDFVDIDNDLKDIAEKYILKQKLDNNKTFHAEPARAFLRRSKKQYDLIALDIFLHETTIPEHLTTVEFFEQIKEHLKENGIFAGNFVMPVSLNHPFSKNTDATIRHVFSSAERHVITERKEPLWQENPNQFKNVVYTYKHIRNTAPAQLYTDNKNRMFLDKQKTLKH